jgi:hypothetical protein
LEFAAMPSFFDFTVTGIDHEPDLLGPLRGKVVLAATRRSTRASSVSMTKPPGTASQ